MRRAQRAKRRGLAALALCAVATLSSGAPALAQPPPLSAAEAVLVETDVGQKVFALHASREVAIASTTKLMTAYVTLENEPLTRKLVEQPYAAGAGESLAGLTPGVKYSVGDLLAAMLLPSGNDVAHTLAIDVGGTIAHFIDEMNAAARRLGLHHSHYATPVGLDTPGNYSSARDLEKLARALLKNPFLASVVRKTAAYLPGGIVVYNRNKLVGAYPYVVGVKTGHTAAAGYCLVGAASWHGVHLISVVLGDPSEAASFADSLALLRYGLALYHRVVLAVAGQGYAAVPTTSGQQVELVAQSGASVVARHGALRIVLRDVPAVIQEPVAAGTQEGEIDAVENGTVVASVPLVTQTAVPALPLPASSGPSGVTAGPLQAARGE